MKLSEHMREKISRLVIADVPTVNYKEQAETLLRQYGEALVDLPVKAFIKAGYGHLLKVGYGHVRVDDARGGRTVNCSIRGLEDGWAEKLPPEQIAEVYDLAKSWLEQDRARDELRLQVYRSLRAFTTVPQLRKAMPELMRYLPEKAQVLETPPAVVSVVAALAEAGWKPKEIQA